MLGAVGIEQAGPNRGGYVRSIVSQGGRHNIHKKGSIAEDRDVSAFRAEERDIRMVDSRSA